MDKSLQSKFEHKTWEQEDKDKPRSGSGSTLRRTRRLRRALPGLMKQYSVKTFYDGACGDWTWMSAVDLSGVKYIGGDISKEVIDKVKAEHGGKDRKFVHLDLSSGKLPKCDMVMVRECLIHLTDTSRWAVFANIHKAKIPYILMTVDLVNENIPLEEDGQHRNFNPMLAPFNFPDPIHHIAESSDDLDMTELTDAHVGPWKRQRAMALWTHEQLGEVLKGRPKS